MREPLPLLLLPGTLCDERLWSQVTPGLRGQAACRHVAWAGERTAADAAARLLREAPPRFALAGMSMGGSVALEVCAQAPRRVRALALVSARPRCDAPGSAPARAEDLAFARRHGMRALVRDRLWNRYVHARRIDDPALRDMVAAMAESAGLDAYEAQHQLLASRRDHQSTLASLEMPVLIAAGDADALCPPPEQAEMARLAAGARYCTRVEFAGCGHLSPLEAPQPLAAALCDWLRAADADP